MKICPYCGEENRDQNIVCSTCGGHLKAGDNAIQTHENHQSYSSSVYRTSYPVKVAYYPNGGLIFWSIITILLCTIPGVIALVNATSINNCTAVSVQERRISAAQTWNAIGTVLGVIVLIVYIIASVNS